MAELVVDEKLEVVDEKLDHPNTPVIFSVKPNQSSFLAGTISDSAIPILVFET